MAIIKNKYPLPRIDDLLDQLKSPLFVKTPIGAKVALGRVYHSCEIEVADHQLSFNFIVLDIHTFDVILDMDWLTYFQASIDCHCRRVSVCLPSGDSFYFLCDQGERCIPPMYDLKG